MKDIWSSRWFRFSHRSVSKGNFSSYLRVDKEVLRFEVSVENPLLVAELYPGYQLVQETLKFRYYQDISWYKKL